MSISDFTDLMPHTVSHSELASRDEYGAPTYGTETDYTARVLYKQQKVVRSDGREVLARGVMWIAGTPTIDPEDRITLPDDSTPVILAVERVPDESGIHHVKVYFG